MNDKANHSTEVASKSQEKQRLRQKAYSPPADLLNAKRLLIFAYRKLLY